ncbi:MAG: group I intron-associated PD-(D/E)XK endonuclease [Pyrinomonadaceae bacterium]
MNTGDIGNLSEAGILAAFVAAGYLVSVPFGSGHKYDLVADDRRRLYRVQCKTGRVRNGVLIFNAYSLSGSGGERRNYRGLADLFAILNPEDNLVYLVPVNDVGMSDIYLRLVPSGNGQSRGIRWAADYALRHLALEIQHE